MSIKPIIQTNLSQESRKSIVYISSNAQEKLNAVKHDV